MIWWLGPSVMFTEKHPTHSVLSPGHVGLQALSPWRLRVGPRGLALVGP